MSDKFSGVKFFPVLIGVALAFVIGAIVLIGLRGVAGTATGGNVTELAALSQAIPLHAGAAIQGDVQAFEALKVARTRFAELTAQIDSLNNSAKVGELEAGAQVVLDAKNVVLAVHTAADQANILVPRLLQSLGNVVSGFGAARVESISRQLERFEATGLRVNQDMSALAAGVGETTATARRLSDGLDYIGQVVGELGGEEAGLGLPRVQGADAEQKLKAVAAVYRELGEVVRGAIGSVDRLSAAQTAARKLVPSANALYPTLTTLTFPGAASSGAGNTIPLALLAAASVALAALAVLFRSVANIRKMAEKQAAQNQRNQEAILRLLDELSNLADGDLTVQATVTEDVTGAIADSINYAIEALRELVTTINSTAITLDTSAKQALAAAGHLAKASVAQSKQVASASESAAAMAASVEEVSGNAERSADVARHSVDIAHKGGDAVRRTIDGMNAIRETIQETSKRIKRLGESSQEIGNIVELINDIAEQTNILALNASIQASMAGEAGRGFAVVADEVQRLAERAANATKQIEVLVRTIQADTNEAVVSMERSTTDVVGGALLAENAGAALEEIEQVSNQIASLVQNISASARQQTSTAQNIARNMQVLREISAQTAENSSATSNSIGKLAQLSTQLRKSVAGFRLPDAGTSAAAAATTAAVKDKPTSPASADVRKVSGLSG